MGEQAEIKVSLEAPLLERALETLTLRKPSALTVWFFDDVSPGADVPLYSAGVVIRARIGEGDAGSDCTVKLRPCRCSQLVGPWWDADAVRVEQDWAATRTLAASFEVELSAETDGAIAPGRPAPAALLTPEQQSFLDACAALPVNPLGLTALGPVAATKWKSVGGAGLDDLDLRAERWTLPGLDVLELSCRAEVEQAADLQGRLHAALAAVDLLPTEASEAKTARVIRSLSRAQSA